MCTKVQLAAILDSVALKTKNIFKEDLHSVILYGSYARGDYDDESDLDIMVLVKTPKHNLSLYRKEVDNLCGELLYDYGIVVSITEKDIETYNRYADILPFYKNIEKEGIKIA